MWDNHVLLRKLASALFGISVLAMLYGAAYYAVHMPGLFPLKKVRLASPPQRVNAEEVLATVRQDVDGNFFTVDIQRLRTGIERLPWVRSVGIRREFPDSLTLVLEEHEALARWNGTALVNTHGEVFEATTDRVLPEFVGNEGESFEVMQRYNEFGKQIAPLNLAITRLMLTPRHAWRLTLDNGMALELGREDMEQRLTRFVTVYPYSLAGSAGSIKYVDLRYRNGFALGGAIKG